MSVGSAPRQRSGSTASAGALPFNRSTTPMSATESWVEQQQRPERFQPCAATASLFLYAQGATVMCLHHDTLAVERRFERHRNPVTLLAVDNVSERGAGRLVLSYDANQVAIVWDLFTGDEISRFESFSTLTVAAWMKNGHITFGDVEGHVLVFDPSTQEHRSALTIKTPVTAIAPATDCHTYVIGYENGTILIATVQPRFTILHTLVTQTKPSAVVGLAWHASSSKQKSDMLAVQCADGDLRVWSIAKPAIADEPKVIRNLVRSDTANGGLHWIAWSKNGRVLQYAQGETWAWDVRTKHVAYEPIPTAEPVRGIANFGPGATLFTLGPNNTVQQYETNPPALVKTVTHDPKHPASSQSTPKLNASTIPGAAPPLPLYKSIDPPKNQATLSTIQRATESLSNTDHARQMRSGMVSPLSTASRTESISSRGSGHRNYRAPSISAASGTTFSTMSPSLVNRDSAISPFWPSTASVASSRRSKSSRLRNEVLHSPEGTIIDLFPNTRARLASLPYAPQVAMLDQKTATPEQLRRQMLEIVFGWQGDIEPMIRDELKRQPVGSMNATLLAKWLGDVDVDMMSSMPSDAISSNDWMLLALSSMSGNGAAGQQMARTFATRLVSQGDIHTGATVLMGIKDFDEAVDIYISRNYFMEAILLTCLLFPDDWQRQAQLVRRWGEYVVENSQQHLAIRCFTCTGTNTSVPWASPTQSPFQGNNPAAVPTTFSPPVSPPPAEPQRQGRMTTKNSSLKLITTFGPGDRSGVFRLPGAKGDDRTPTNAPGVTPIAESAMSPGGTPSTTLRPTLRSRTPAGRNRLSSIGETPIDVNPPALPIGRPNPLPTPDNSGSDAERDTRKKDPVKEELPMIEDPPLTLSSARYDPAEDSKPEKLLKVAPPQIATPQSATPQTATPQTAIPGSAQRRNMLSNSDINSLNNAQDRPRARNGSRDRKPNGLHIQMPSLSQLNLNAIAMGSNGASPKSDRRKSSGTSSLQSGSTSNRYDARFDALSPPVTGQSWTSNSTKSPSISGRSVDPYISSLEEANFYAQQQKEKARRQRSRESNTEKKSRSRTRQRDASESRGRTGQRYIRPPKRSPSSPVPMSPEDLYHYRESRIGNLDAARSRDSSPEEGPRPNSHNRRKPMSKNRSVSKMSEQSHRTTVRHMSPDRRDVVDARVGRSRGESRRRRSPSELQSPVDRRGRSKSRTGGSNLRSPSSPLPMSNQAALYRYDDDEVDDGPMRIVEANRQRLRSRQRSTSRHYGERHSSRPRDIITDAPRVPLEDLQYPSVQSATSRDSPKTSDAERTTSDSNAPKLQRNRSHRSLKKAAAARELEARRESLNLRTLATVSKPAAHARPGMGARSQSDVSNMMPSPPSHWRSQETFNQFSDPDPGEMSPPERTNSAGPSPIGLPATPRAMRHPKYSRDEKVPEIPNIPDQFYATGQPMQEPSRSISAPVPEPDMSIPADIPLHPAFQRHLPRSAVKPNFHPLNDIGKHRRTPSMENAISPPAMGSIGEALEGIHETAVIDVPVSSHTPPAVIPELQHLAKPPPPPPPPFGRDAAHHSLSSGSGVGTINIVMDDDPPEAPASLPPAVALPPAPRQQRKLSKSSAISPPLPLMQSPPASGNSMNSAHSNPYALNAAMHSPPTASPPPAEPGSDGRGHRRGRSIDQMGLGNKITRVAERMRSASRGRNAAGNRARDPSRGARDPSRDARSPQQTQGPSPYETKISVGYF